jgi:hypothetical protein
MRFLSSDVAYNRRGALMPIRTPCRPDASSAAETNKPRDEGHLNPPTGRRYFLPKFQPADGAEPRSPPDGSRCFIKSESPLREKAGPRTIAGRANLRGASRRTRVAVLGLLTFALRDSSRSDAARIVSRLRLRAPHRP